MKKSKGFSHFILTRFNCGVYLSDDGQQWAEEWMDARMKVFVATKKSVLSQNVDFKWVISIDPNTPQEIREKIFTDDRMIMHEASDINFIKEIFNGTGLVKTPWIITSRLDNDDQYRPGALKAIQDAFTRKPGIIDIPYNQFYKGKRYPSHRDNPNSPFLSLIEETRYAIRTCYARPHNKMSQDWPGPRFVDLKPDKNGKPKPLAYMVIHESNMANRLISDVRDNL